MLMIADDLQDTIHEQRECQIRERRFATADRRALAVPRGAFLAHGLSLGQAAG
jgi:hypothetical protein